MGKRRRNSDSDSDDDGSNEIVAKRPRKEEIRAESDSDSEDSFNLPDAIDAEAEDVSFSNGVGDRKSKKNVSFKANPVEAEEFAQSDSDHEDVAPEPVVKPKPSPKAKKSSGDDVAKTPSKKSKRTSSEKQNNFTRAVEDDSSGGEQTALTSVDALSSEFTYYLIRKPIEVSIDDLTTLRLPTDPARKKKLKLKTEHGNYSVRSTSCNGQMLYVPPPEATTGGKDSKKIKPTAHISGHFAVTRSQDEIIGGPVFEEGDEVPEIIEMPLPMKEIKKKSHLKLDGLQQRLRAYGTKFKKRKHRRSLPNLREGLSKQAC